MRCRVQHARTPRWLSAAKRSGAVYRNQAGAETASILGFDTPARSAARLLNHRILAGYSTTMCGRRCEMDRMNL